MGCLTQGGSARPFIVSTKRVSIKTSTRAVRELKWKAKGKMKRAERIVRSRVEVVAVFHAHRPDNRSPAKPASDGIEAGIKWIMANLPGFAEGIGKEDQRPFGCQGLLKFHAPEHIRFGPDNLALRILGGGFAFLIAADRVLPTWKETAGEWQVIAGASQRQRRAVTQSEVKPAPAS